MAGELVNSRSPAVPGADYREQETLDTVVADPNALPLIPAALPVSCGAILVQTCLRGRLAAGTIPLDRSRQLHGA